MSANNSDALNAAIDRFSMAVVAVGKAFAARGWAANGREKLHAALAGRSLERAVVAIRTSRETARCHETIAESANEVTRLKREFYGAPGDWGYHNPRGDGLLELYEATDDMEEALALARAEADATAAKETPHADQT